MNDLNQNSRYAARTAPIDHTVDEGLRVYMLKVYNYMALGIALTGVVAYLAYLMAFGDSIGGVPTLTAFGNLIYTPPLVYVIMFSPLAFIFYFSAKINSMSGATAQTMFWIYSSLIGLSIGSIFAMFSMESLIRVFFITSVTFGGLSLWSYTTKKDLSSIGSFLFMGFIGLLVASIVNIFLQDGVFALVLNVLCVLIFAGFTAYYTQETRAMYRANDDQDTQDKKAIFGALGLYISFLNMFLALLHLFGSSE